MMGYGWERRGMSGESCGMMENCVECVGNGGEWVWNLNFHQIYPK